MGPAARFKFASCPRSSPGKARALFSSISPARSGWIAPGRIGFMSTQRRDCRNSSATDVRRRSPRRRRALDCMVGVGFPGLLSPAPSAPFVHAQAGGLTATFWPATNSLPSDSLNIPLVRLVPQDICRGSWPPGSVSLAPEQPRLSLNGVPSFHSPSCLAYLPPSLPRVPVATGRRTERYDGKRDLYFQHSA